MSKRLIRVTDSFVYHYLVEQGHFKSTEKLLKIRRKCTNDLRSLEGLQIFSVFYFLTSHYYSQKISNGIVLKYLKNHKKLEVRELAKKFLKKLSKKKQPVQLEGEIPSFQEIYIDSFSQRQVIFPISEKNSNTSKLKRKKLKR